MSSDEYLQTIREIASRIESWGDDAYRMGENEPAIAGQLMQINTNTEALQAELDAERARTDRFRACWDYLWCVIPEYVARDSAIAASVVYSWFEDAEEQTLQPGDLPDDESEGTA